MIDYDGTNTNVQLKLVTTQAFWASQSSFRGNVEHLGVLGAPGMFEVEVSAEFASRFRC